MKKMSKRAQWYPGIWKNRVLSSIVMILLVGNLILVSVQAEERVEKSREKVGKIGGYRGEIIKSGTQTTGTGDNDPYVYVTRKGKNYHKEGCGYLRGSKIKIRLSEARRRGYKSCPRCYPPKEKSRPTDGSYRHPSVQKGKKPSTFFPMAHGFPGSFLEETVVFQTEKL